MKKVIHLIPYDGIGGVESAAHTMEGISDSHLNFKVFYIFKKHSNKRNYLTSLSPIRIFKSVFELLSIKPDLVIVSLWRSCIVAILFKLLSPKTKIVLFLHYPHDYHLADKIFTKLMSLMSYSLWADSQDTLNSRIPSFPSDSSDVISFVARRFQPITQNIAKPDFIFWGRLHEQKCIERAINIFAIIQSKYPEATYTIIGPDGGELANLKNQVSEMGIQESVIFKGPQNINSIKEFSSKSSFYLQTSKLEGMAMSVVEAMQLGLLPVITPVGEIKNYCKDSVNSLYIINNESVSQSIFNLLKDRNLYNIMKERAIAHWQNHEIYSESIIRASKKTLNINNNEGIV